jgi:hypothetical protein
MPIKIHGLLLFEWYKNIFANSTKMVGLRQKQKAGLDLESGFLDCGWSDSVT